MNRENLSERMKRTRRQFLAFLARLKYRAIAVLLLGLLFEWASHWVNWPLLSSDFLRAAGHACFIAALLAWTVDAPLKEEIIRMVIQVMGYSLPARLRKELRRFHTVDLVREGETDRYILRPLDKQGRVRIAVETEVQIVNYGQAPQVYTPQTTALAKLDPHFELLRIDRLDADQAVLVYEATPDEPAGPEAWRRPMQIELDRLRSFSDDVPIERVPGRWRASAEAVPIPSGKRLRVRWYYTLRDCPDDYEHSGTWQLPTTTVTVRWDCPRDYGFVVYTNEDFSAHVVPRPILQQGTREAVCDRVFMPGEQIHVWWYRRS